QDPRQVPAVGADGTIYVAYASGHNPFPAGQVLPTSLIVARSHDDGVTFTRTVAAANITRSRAPTEEAEAISSLAADPSPRRAGHLALAWADQRSGESRILVVTSIDGGAHWSAPADVAGDPPGLGNQHDHPQIAFAPDGRLIIVWRDRRGTDGAWSSPYQLFARALLVTSRGAVAPGRVATVTARPQQPNSSTMFDEYLGITVGREGLSVAWNQPKNGVAASYYRRIALSSL
ncbi:MAG TPA: sialidase family protein, partial [Mycobacteriales bacterium]|nr:sialidase family protein [Mycobacteriales bacterium]